jgi:hypothetical protein
MNRLERLWTKHCFALSGAEVLASGQLQRVASRAPLLEIKHRVGKSSQCFTLQNWSVCVSEGVGERGSCVGRWVSDGNSMYGSPAGTYSWGVWVQGAGVLENLGE